MSRAATAVKMQSKGQDTFSGSVKQSSSALGPMSSTAGNQEAWPSICACAVNRRLMGQGKNGPSNGQGHYWMVQNLDCGRSSGHGAYGSDPP